MSLLRQSGPRVALLISITSFNMSLALAAEPATREDQILIQGLPAGSQTVTTENTGSVRAEYSFNDRGRGDHIIATWKLDAAGVPIEYSGSGNDYAKANVSETFHLSGGKATWRNRSEQGGKAVKGEGFYVPANGPPEFTGVLARALLRARGHKLALLPAGEARINAVGSISLPLASGARLELTQYEISGLDFGPTRIWLDRNGQLAASISGWFAVLSVRPQARWRSSRKPRKLPARQPRQGLPHGSRTSRPEIW